MNTENLFAKIVSYLFHPLLLPTIGVILIFNLSGTGLLPLPFETRIFIFTLTFIATLLLPLLNAVFLLKTRQISSLEMKTKEERKIPYLLSAIFYSAESYILMKLDIVALIKALMLGATFLIVLVLLINIFWKISAHMVGIGGLFGMMLAMSARLQLNINYSLIALILIAGLIGFSRLKLNSHSSAQVYCGFLLGVSVPLTLFL